VFKVAWAAGITAIVAEQANENPTLKALEPIQRTAIVSLCRQTTPSEVYRVDR